LARRKDCCTVGGDGLGAKRDKRLLDAEAAIEMANAGETQKSKFQIKHARAVLAVVFG